MAQTSAAPVPHITEPRDRLFDLTAGPGRARADPVSTRDAVAGETPACWATSASLGRNFVSVPDTPASCPAIFGARRLARRPIPQAAHSFRPGNGRLGQRKTIS